eukprot:719468-Prymnesium_polylepis.2
MKFLRAALLRPRAPWLNDGTPWRIREGEQGCEGEADIASPPCTPLRRSPCRPPSPDFPPSDPPTHTEHPHRVHRLQGGLSSHWRPDLAPVQH